MPPIVIGNQTFIATCALSGYGTVIFQEVLNPPCSETIIPEREIIVSGELNSLCPKTEYTLSLHKYNNVRKTCKNAGPIINSEGIVSRSLRTDEEGALSFCKIKIS